ncbi:MAG: acyl-CoA/acyl-ACP dehydrogenase [Actinomycetota bacterium]|nr:acyl-CoA/acyl-ACP dehydrogenase [Actinomycetota bacterium]
MELDFTADQDELRASVRAVLDRECAVHDVRALVEARVRGEEPHDGPDGPTLDRRLWHTVTALDWPGLTIAAEYGGVGLGFVELAVVAEELGRALAPGPLLPTLTQLVPALRAGGWAEGLTQVAAGRLAGSLALTEEAGWSLDEIATTAEHHGSTWRLRGRKRNVQEAGAVDEYAVVARVESGLALVRVPAEAVVVEPVRPLDPTRGLGHLVFESVEVEDDHLRPIGRELLARVLEEATIGVALDMVGCCQAILDTTVAYARERVQFGVPIGSFQAVQHKLVDMFVSLERARATAYFAAACVAEDDPRRTCAAATAKAAAGDCQRLVGSGGIQLLGGIGYTWEHDQQLYVKRAKADDALFGTAHEHRRALADHLGI